MQLRFGVVLSIRNFASGGLTNVASHWIASTSSAATNPTFNGG
jgi:hypothetical protein